MDNRMTIAQLRLTSANAQLRKQVQAQADSSSSPASFKEVLNRNVLKFSQHAELRMQQRGISFKPETINEIVNAIDQAAAKGAKDSLVVYRDVAMIVNIPSRTVVTAMDGKSLQGNVFTQIDSAVIVN